MKYIRTRDGIYETIEGFKPQFEDMVCIPNEGLTRIIKQADTIEELCDEFVVAYDNENHNHIVYGDLEWTITKATSSKINYVIYGAIWTDKGLVYVAKMNDKGELCLL